MDVIVVVTAIPLRSHCDGPSGLELPFFPAFARRRYFSTARSISWSIRLCRQPSPKKARITGTVLAPLRDRHAGDAGELLVVVGQARLAASSA